MLHRQLIETIRSGPDLALIVASERGSHFSLTAEHEVSVSRLESLGAKIDAAFRFAFGLGYQSVLLLAGDVAGVDLPLLDEAFTALEGQAEPCVVGPSGDGGFYLLGLSQSGTLASSMAWEEIAWCGRETANDLIARASALGATVTFVRAVDDIDTLADARRISARLTSAFTLLRCQLRSHLSARTPAPAAAFLPPTSRPGVASQFRGPPVL